MQGRMNSTRHRHQVGRKAHGKTRHLLNFRRMSVVGYGIGKAKEVPSAIRKGIEAAKKTLRRINVLEGTIPHQVLGKYESSQVLLKPAPAGTGVIAGGAVRAVISACGIPNVLTKSIGRRNAHNVVKATIVALESLRERGQVAEMRGLAVEKL